MAPGNARRSRAGDRQLRVVPQRHSPPPARTSTHLPRPAACDTCHATTAWKPATKVDHAQVHRHLLRRATTARGRRASTRRTSRRPRNAAPATRRQRLEAEHRSPTRASSTAVPAATTARAQPASTRPHHVERELRVLPRDDHVEAGHSGRPRAGPRAPASAATTATRARGKNAGHIAASNDCQTCHVTSAWKPANFSHAGVTTGCASLSRRHEGNRQERDPYRSRAPAVKPATRRPAWRPVDEGRPCAGQRQLRVLPQRHDRHRQASRSHRIEHGLRARATRRSPGSRRRASITRR